MRKNILITLLLALIAFAPAANAQKNDAERDAWFKEMSRYKHEFIVKELKLTDAQQKAFFPLYDAMEAEVRRTIDEGRAMEKSVLKKGDKATDTEREKAAEALYELKGKEGAIEMRYFARFKTVLSPEQLLRLKSVERKFNRHILKEHRKHKRMDKKARGAAK